MFKKSFLSLLVFLIAYFGANAQTGFTENFNSGTISSNWWAGSSQYSLNQAGGKLKIGVNKYQGWVSYGMNLSSVIDVSSNPIVNIKVQSDQDITIDVYIVDASNVNKNISRRISRSDSLTNVCWDFTGVTGIDLKKISKMYFAINGMGLTYRGNLQFEDLKLGTDAEKISNFSGVSDLTIYQGSKKNVIYLQALQNVQNIVFANTPTLIKNIEYSPVSATGTMTISFDATDVTGSEKLTLQSTGTTGWMSNSFSFSLTVDGNTAPTFSVPATYKCKVGEQQNITITDISDGDGTARQDIGFNLTSTNASVIGSDCKVVYTQDAPAAQLQFTPTASGAATASLSLNDGQTENASTTKNFTVTAFDKWNTSPTMDAISSVTVYNNAGEQSFALTGISDGDSNTQNLTFLVESSDETIVPVPTVQYTTGSEGILKFTPQTGKTGKVTITVKLTDNGGAADNNGNEFTSQTFTIDVQAPPLTGYVVPLSDYTSDRTNKLWNVEFESTAQNISYVKDGTDDVLNINCLAKSTWTGLWYGFNNQKLDLTQNPYITMWVKSDQDIKFTLYFWDYKMERNNIASTEFKSIPANVWTKVSFDFYGKMVNSKSAAISADKIDSLLFNYHPVFSWPFTTWAGNVSIKDIRIGDKADGTYSHPNVCTIDDMASLTVYSSETSGSFQLSNITNGNKGTATVSAVSGNTAVVSNPTVSATTDGKATLNYTLTGTPGTATVTVTAAAEGSTSTVKTFVITVISANPTTTSTVTVELDTKYQTMLGIGTYVNETVEPYLNNYTDDFGGTVARLGIIGNQLEPVNDNNDPYVLDRSALNYDAFNWDFIKSLNAKGVDNFILTVWSMPAWMKQNASEDFFMANALTWENTTNKVDTVMYQEYAEYSVALAKTFKEKTGLDLYGIGLQNEPGFCEPYGSAILSPSLFVKLINIVGKRFEQEGINCKLYMAEQIMGQTQYSIDDYLTALQNDETAWKYCDIEAVHGYASDGITNYTAGCSKWAEYYSNAQKSPHPKALWMTETESASSTWDNIMTNVGAMSTAFSCGNVSLWTQWGYLGHYILQGKSNQLAFAESQFAKFAKPGSVRVAATSADENLLVNSFVNTQKNGKSLATVIINKAATPISIKLTGDDLPTTFDTYQTYYLQNFKEQVNGAQKEVAYLLPAKSITTFVAPLPNAAPTIDPIKDLVINKNSSEHVVTLTGITDGGENNQSILITPTIVSGSTVISNAYVVYSSPENTAKLYFTVNNEQVGNASIQIEVADNGTVNNKTTVNCNIQVSNKLTSVSTVKENQLIVYPNPAIDYINLNLPNLSYKSVTIVNLMGETVLKQNVNSVNEQININRLNTGLYFILVNGENGLLKKSFIKK